jgi:hypothetical protein
VLLLIGWMMRAIILGAKFDECPKCGVPGPHLIIRKTHWFTIFRIPVVLLWISHGVICPECGYVEGINFMAARRALRDGRLPLGRQRAGFEAYLREQLGGVEAETWEQFGLAPGATEEAIRAQWRQLAKKLHPDTGGDPAAFVRMQAILHRLLASSQTSVKSLPDPAELFDPVIRNPKRGFFDFYTKAWAALVVVILVAGALQPPRSTATGTSSSGTFGNAPVVPAVAGTAHRCWYTGSTLNGCQTSLGTAMLFGSSSGIATTCWFVEPLRDGQSANCNP